MFDTFGEFGSAKELNGKAAELKEAGDRAGLIALAAENGIDREDAEDYMDGTVAELASPVMAAVGKLDVEAGALGLKGILLDWKDAVAEQCMEDGSMQAAVRKKDKHLKNCLAALLKYSFENKVQVSGEVVRVTKVMHNGREEPMRGPVYLGIPDKSQVKKIIRIYYGAEGKEG